MLHLPDVVLMSDVRIAAIPVRDCAEPLVDVRGHLPLGTTHADEAGAFAQLRQGVLERLLVAAGNLPAGLSLVLVEGYRPLTLQTSYFDEHRAELRAAYPHWSDDEVHVATSRYISPPAVAPHTAGAAVDVTVVDRTGAELDFGCAVNADPEASGGACYTDSPLVDGAARRNRQVLAEAMTAAGLVNYPTEWWHWSFGDRYWALVSGAPAARYGPVAFP